MNLRRLIPVVTLLLGGIMCAAAPAHAYSWYWSKVEVKTSSWKTCMNFASDAARHSNLTNVKRDNVGVGGTRNGISVAITCVATGGNSPAMAVVIVVGDSDQPTHQLHNDLVAFITKVGCIDSPC
jgi:hypothetical protein